MDSPENWDKICDLISLKCEVMNKGSNENFFNENFFNHLKTNWLKQEDLGILVSQSIIMHHLGVRGNKKWKYNPRMYQVRLLQNEGIKHLLYVAVVRHYLERAKELIVLLQEWKACM